MTAEIEGCGVYFLFRKKRLVYVGRSKKPRGRIDVHRKNGRAFDHAMHVQCDPADMAWVERALIEALNPPQNKLGVTEAREEVEDAPQPVTQIIYQAPPAPDPYKPDPHETISVTHARYAAEKRGLKFAFEEDFRSGALRSYPRNPMRDAPRKPRYVTRGDLDAWFETALGDRAKAGWRATV